MQIKNPSGRGARLLEKGGPCPEESERGIQQRRRASPPAPPPEGSRRESNVGAFLYAGGIGVPGLARPQRSWDEVSIAAYI
jgi:hypothetical protein